MKQSRQKSISVCVRIFMVSMSESMPEFVYACNLNYNVLDVEARQVCGQS